MTQHPRLMVVSTVASAIGLAGCGGGGGGGSGIISTPPPPPTQTCPDGSVIPATATCPTPPPPPSNFVNVFPSITTTTDFAVLGLQNDALGSSSSALVSSGFAVRYDAASDAYLVDLPSLGPGKFHSGAENEGYWSGILIDADGNGLEAVLNIFKPSPTNPDLALEYTSFGGFDDDGGFYDYDDALPAGAFAFGTATLAGEVPITGSATYDAIIRGATLDNGRLVGGTASLQFNFGAGTLAGSFSPYTFDATGGQASLGSYGFVNTVFGTGSTTFSGQLQHVDAPGPGTFNGLFTGPAAQELMTRWIAPYRNPDNNQWSEMFGVWVGKKP